MKTKIYAESFGHEYAIVEDKCSYTVLRKLPDSEYWEYYREGLDELYMDGAHTYWLPIHHAWAQEDAERFLLGIGVDSGAQEAVPSEKDEGRLTISGRNVKAIFHTEKLGDLAEGIDPQDSGDNARRTTGWRYLYTQNSGRIRVEHGC